MCDVITDLFQVDSGLESFLGLFVQIVTESSLREFLLPNRGRVTLKFTHKSGHLSSFSLTRIFLKTILLELI